jgi:hypothetical protein
MVVIDFPHNCPRLIPQVVMLPPSPRNRRWKVMIIHAGASVKIASSRIASSLILTLSPSHKRHQVVDVAVIVDAQAEEGRDCEQMANSGLLTIYKRQTKCTEAG